MKITRLQYFRNIAARRALFGLLSWVVVFAPAQAPKLKVSTASAAITANQPETSMTQSAWRESLFRLQAPKAGCYTSSFPDVEWKPVACVTPPPYPMVVGGRLVGSTTPVTNDFAARTTGTISWAEGSFTSVSGGTTESGPVNGTGSAVADAYTLQLNTNFFTTPLCNGPNTTNCRGWQQFVYRNDPTNNKAYIYIQYWVVQYSTGLFRVCPPSSPFGAGTVWTLVQTGPATPIDCYAQSPAMQLMAGPQPVSNLGSMKLKGLVTASSDQIIMTIGANPPETLTVANTGTTSPAGTAAAAWTDAEFNVFGDGGGSQAAFNPGTTIVVRTAVNNGTLVAPTCLTESFTRETNNLALDGPPSITPQTFPTIELTESYTPTMAASCAMAAGTGDTHLSTFGGLFYDFQASGDFVLAQTEKDFTVQARQVSGAPTWPDASVNKAVATRMGETRVAVCAAPSRLEVDGAATDVADGKKLSLLSGVDILRNGNVYLVSDRSGNSMRAEVNDTYINVSVGLGKWPTKVRGVLANVDGHVDQIETRTGMVLTAPFASEDLYGKYADSWRVPAKESLLSVCGGEARAGRPRKPLYAENLEPRVYKRARAACTAAGVKVKPLLDACTLDVAVIGRKTAAKVFVSHPAPAAVGRVVRSRRGHPGPGQ